MAGRLSHGKLQRQWPISRKRHGRRLAAFLESLDGQGFTDARIRRQARTGRLERQQPLSRLVRRKRSGAVGFLRPRPGRHEAHRADRSHRTRRQLRLATGRRTLRERWPRLAPDAVASRKGHATHRRADGRFGGQRAALVAGRQTPGRRREEGTRSPSTSWWRDESRAARSHAGRAHGQCSSVSTRSRRSASRPSPKKPRQEVWWPQGAARWRARFRRAFIRPTATTTFNEADAPDRLPQQRVRRRVLHREPRRAEAALPPHRQAR